MYYLTFAPVTQLEHFIFKKCSFNQPPISHSSPLWGLDKPSLGTKSTYSKMTRWLQQSQGNIDHFCKKDTALVKALRQYHFASNVLEGRTQWRFQKSWILYRVLDVIAVNMESMKRCLDFHDLTPVDQGFRHWDPNLCQLKAVAIKEVTHLTMILILDEDHMHYSDAFGNIFKGGSLCKKHFSDRLSGIKMRKGGATQAIVWHFCPHACSNNNYAYYHLAAIHLNIQWGCGTCFGYISGYLSKIREHIQSHHKKSSREQSHSSHRKDEGSANQTHHWMASQLMRRGWSKSSRRRRRRRRMMMMQGPVPMLMTLVWMPQILIRNPTYQSPLSVVQTLACHPSSLGVDYQRDGMVWPQSSFDGVSMLSFYWFLFTTRSVDLMSLLCSEDCRVFF